MVVSLLLVAGAVALVMSPAAGDARRAAAVFWGAGALLLPGLLAAGYAVLSHLGASRRHAPPSLLRAGVAAVAATPRRSMLRAALMSIAVFMVVAVAANRRDPGLMIAARSSGGGGFAFYGELTAPLVGDLDELTAGEVDAGGVAVVGVRRRQGDDASCLNLNRVQRPPVLGVPVSELDARAAFTFAAWAEGMDSAAGWQLLEQPLADGAIPAVADLTVITWGLGKKLGDELEVRDAAGRVQRLRLVAGLRPSVFQGQVLISEASFLRLYPAGGGYEVLLVDAPSGRREAVAADLRRRFQDRGLELERTGERLARFQAVENTYLDIFLALGGLGLLLGTAGMGLLTLREVLDRRPALAALTAMGFAHRHLALMLVAEQGTLVVLGLASGAVAALVAVFPAASAPGTPLPWLLIGGLLATIPAVGLGSSLLAARWALRGSLIGALRDD